MPRPEADRRAPVRRVPLPVLALIPMTIGLAGADGRGGIPSDPSFTATRVDGSTVSGRLRRLDVAGGVVLSADEAGPTASVPTLGLVKLTRDTAAPPAPADRGIVLFPGGDRLHAADIVAANETSLEVHSAALGTALAVPLDTILGLVLVPPLDADAAAELADRVRSEPRESEVLWLTNGDKLVGGLLGLDDKKVTFAPKAGKLELDRGGVVALGFDPKLVDAPKSAGPYFELALVDGTRLGAAEVAVEAGQVRAVTRQGLAIRFPVGELATVHVQGGSVAYLSDRSPTVEKTVGYLGPTRPPARDRSVDGLPLRLRGRTYDHGLGAQSKTYLAYRLEPGVRRFQATVGLDDRAGPLGSVVFRVIADGKERFASPPASSRDTPLTLDLDLAGVQTLILVTDFGERGEVRDHADWAEARLIR